MIFVVVAIVTAAVIFVIVRFYDKDELQKIRDTKPTPLPLPVSPKGYLFEPELGKDRHDLEIYTARAIMSIKPQTYGITASAKNIKRIEELMGEIPQGISDADAWHIIDRCESLCFVNALPGMVDFAKKRGLCDSYYIDGKRLVREIFHTLDSKQAISFFLACVYANEKGIFACEKWDNYMNLADEFINSDRFMDSYREHFEKRILFYGCSSQSRSTVAYKMAKERVMV